MHIHENRTLGIDLGIASCGWAVIEQDEEGGGRIVALGARTWDAPETDKDHTPTQQIRRGHRGRRRVLKRRRQRMSEIRRLFRSHGLIEVQGPTGLRIAELDPWSLRAEGLERKLTGPELAVALGHIAKHRGFASNRKGELAAEADESSKMLKAINETRARLAQYRTVGEMFARDNLYADRKRNPDGEFTYSVLREDQAYEVELLFDTQRRLGNPQASTELQGAFTEAAFLQRPLQDIEHLVGPCPFEPTEKRCARRAPSFERLRLLSRLSALTLSEGREQRPLTPDHIAKAEDDFGLQKGFTFKRLRERLGLPEATSFGGVARDDEGRDLDRRARNAAEGTAILRGIIVDAAGEGAWRLLQNTPEKLDTIASVLTFRNDIESIRRGLTQIGLEPSVLKGLMDAVEDGRSLKVFSGAAHISAKAARAMAPYMRKGMTYDQAAAAAGYVHTVRTLSGDIEGTLHERMVHNIRWIDVNVSNPVARKAVIEALKQVHAIIGVHGLPGAIHVKLARDVGKSKTVRDEIKAGIDRRNAAKARLRDQFKEAFGHEASCAEDLLRFELWTEQGGRCLYSERAIAPHQIAASDTTVQVDHILPWSRSADDSFVNKTLCFASPNQDKSGRTPFEWFGGDAERWERYRRAIVRNTAMTRRKKRQYLLSDASVLTETFRPRNLNDTNYTARLVLDLLARLYPETDRYIGVPRTSEDSHKKRRLFARPCPLTRRLRRGLGLEAVIDAEGGKRIADDRRHALDALIVAVTSEGRLNRLTNLVREREKAGLPFDFGLADPPWPSFCEEAQTTTANVFVSRAERRRARGRGHAETVRRVEDTPEGPMVYERKPVGALTEADLNRVKDPHRNAALIASLRQWINDKKPKDRRPQSPKGDPISKVRLRTPKKVDVLVRNGVADRGDIVRVDVFRTKNKRDAWEYYLVPVYPHQVFDPEDWPGPPNAAIYGDTSETNWPLMSDEYKFLYSIYPFSYVKIEKRDGARIEGYFRGADRTTGAIHLSPHYSRNQTVRSIGVKTLRSMTKINVDRLSNRTEIRREKRTWRGVISP